MNYEEFLDAIADDEGQYLECSNGHESLPPRRACPECSATTLSPEPLPDSGELIAVTTIQVATPNFADDTPYSTAIADFGPIRLTGQVRGINPDNIQVGDIVGVDVGESVATDDRVIIFNQR